jgi:hypothetical protein
VYYINVFANYRGLQKGTHLIEKDCLLAIQEPLMGFLMDEVVNPQGKCHTQSYKEN